MSWSGVSLIGERGVEFAAARRCRSGKLMPGRDGPHGLQLQHVGRQIGDGLLRPPASACPTAGRRCWASVGRLLLPPTYFCTSSIFDAGT